MDGILSPAFMQAACAKKKEEEPTVVTLKALVANPTIESISCTGEITIASISEGQEKTETRTDLNAERLAVLADDQTKFTITGEATINELGGECEIV